MIKLIYFDIDGTLRDEVNGVSERTRYAIEQCRKQNIICVICTGRNEESVQEDVKKLPMDGVISGGGCRIQYLDGCIKEEYFPEKTVKSMIEISLDNDFPLALESNNKVYMNYSAADFYTFDFNRKIEHYTLWIQKKAGQQHKIFFKENMMEFWKESPNIHKICIWGKQNKIDELCVKFQKGAEVIQKRKWHDKWYVEFLPKNCNKGTAINWLNAKLNIEKKETMCFGDSENDIDMMKATGIAIAMKSNNTVLEKYADTVCESVAEEGVYKELVRRKIIQDGYEEKEGRNENAKTVVAGRDNLPDLSEKLL